MDAGERPPSGGEGGSRPPAVPDVVGLELGLALRRLERWRTTLRFTAPPRPRGEKGAVRVVACRRVGPEEALELICAREYWDRVEAEPGGRGPLGGAGGDGGGADG